MSKIIHFSIGMFLFLLFVINSLFVIKLSSSSELQMGRNSVIKPIKRQPAQTPGNLNLTESNAFIFAKKLLNGSLAELRHVPRRFVVESLEELDKISLDLGRNLVIWEILKDNKSAGMLNLTDIKQIKGLIRFIPETDLFNFNVSDWEIVDYLGTCSILRRRQTGIISYAIKQVWGEGVMMDLEIVKKMKGLICGFSLMDLRSMPDQVFYQLDSEVFNHITSCTQSQLEIMVRKAKKTLVHGPPQTWQVGTCQNLSKLIKSLSMKDLETIKPEAMAGIDAETIEEMTLEQLQAFSEEQVDNMGDKTLSAYRKITGIIHSNSKNLVCQTLFTLIIYKISLHFLK